MQKHNEEIVNSQEKVKLIKILFRKSIEFKLSEKLMI